MTCLQVLGDSMSPASKDKLTKAIFENCMISLNNCHVPTVVPPVVPPIAPINLDQNSFDSPDMTFIPDGTGIITNVTISPVNDFTNTTNTTITSEIGSDDEDYTHY